MRSPQWQSSEQCRSDKKWSEVIKQTLHDLFLELAAAEGDGDILTAAEVTTSLEFNLKILGSSLCRAKQAFSFMNSYMTSKIIPASKNIWTLRSWASLHYIYVLLVGL